MNYSFQEIVLNPTADSIMQTVTDTNAQSIAYINLTVDNNLEIHLSLNQGVNWTTIPFPTLSDGLNGNNLKKINLITYNSITYICASFSSKATTDPSGNVTNGYGYLYVYDTQNNNWTLVSNLNHFNSEFNSIEKRDSKFYIVNENYNISSGYDENEQKYKINSSYANNLIYIIDVSSGNFSANVIPGSDAYNWNNFINSSIFVNNTSLVGLLSDNNTIVIYNFNDQTWNTMSSPTQYGYPISIVCTDYNLYLIIQLTVLGYIVFLYKDGM